VISFSAVAGSTPAAAVAAVRPEDGRARPHGARMPTVGSPRQAGTLASRRNAACARPNEAGPLPNPTSEVSMLRYALIFFVVAIVAALFGFGGIAAGAAEIGKILFFVFLVLFVVSLVVGLIRRTP